MEDDDAPGMNNVALPKGGDAEVLFTVTCRTLSPLVVTRKVGLVTIAMEKELSIAQGRTEDWYKVSGF